MCYHASMYKTVWPSVEGPKMEAIGPVLLAREHNGLTKTSLPQLYHRANFVTVYGITCLLT